MSDTEERTFYLQLWAFTTGPAIDVMHMYFEFNMLHKTEFETFLNNTHNKHVLFHQCFPEISCCECYIHSLASAGKKGCLNKKQFDLLFDDTSSPQPNHEKTKGTKVTQYCLCRYSAKCGLTVDRLDVTLFYDMVQHCCPRKMNMAWLKCARNVRNFLAHVGNGQVKQSDFQTHWHSLEVATYGFAGELGNICLKKFKKEVSQIKTSSVEDLKKTLKESSDHLIKTVNHLNGFKPLYADVAESKNILQSMQSQQLEQNVKVEKNFERMESLLLGVLANQRIDKSNSSVSVFDSEESIRSDEIRSTSSKSAFSFVSLQCEIESSVLDEDKALKQITNDENEKDGKQFEVKSAEKKCLLLHLQSSREIFKSVESLWYAINSLLKRIVKAGEIDTSVESTMSLKLTLTSPVTEEERKVICAMLSKYGDLNEKHILNQTQSSDEVNFAIKTECFSKTEGGITPSIFEAHQDVIDSIPVKQIKFEIDDTKYDEIFVDVDNLRCLLKIKGLPNDLDQTELEERQPDVKDTQLLYVEWTLSCPSRWNVGLIISNINDNLSTFNDEFTIEYVYNETSSKLIIHTTTQRCVFRSYSSLEVAVKNLLGKIKNVSSIKSTEREELSASVLIMTKPEKEEFPTEFNEEVKTDQLIFGSKDNIVTCEHCTKSFSCKNCTSKMDHIRRLDQALKMKGETIQRLEKALTKREKEMIEDDESDYDSYYSAIKNTINEDDESDYDSYYSAEKNTINEEPEEDTRKTTTAEIEMTGEPEQKKRKTAITSEIENSAITKDNQTEDASKSLNHLVVDMKQALQKLGEIPLLDHRIAKYRTYMKNLKPKRTDIIYAGSQIKPKNEQAILDNLLKEKKKRTRLIAKLKDVIHYQDEFATTDEGYGTDIRFLDVEDPATKCNYCQTKDESQISCYCNDCKIFICDNCMIEHRMKNRYHSYYYLPKILREHKQSDVWKDDFQKITSMKFMTPEIVAILEADILRTYNLSGNVIDCISIRRSEDSNRQIACLNDSTIAVTMPSDNLIEIVTVMRPSTKTDLVTPAGTIMTGGITCRMDILCVAFTDAIRLIDLSGQIQRVINIPSVEILHSVNNDKLLCVYSKCDSDKTMSCLDITNDSLHDFERFPFHPRDVTIDDVGNIIFTEDGVIWQSDSDGKNFKIIMTANYDHWYKHLTYNKRSKMLLTVNLIDDVEVYKKLE